MTDYYKALGVSAQADENQIRKAYRSLVKQYHPDAHPDDEGCKVRFQEISEAYQILGDKEKRKKYDEACAARGSRQRSSGTERRTGTGSNTGGSGSVPPMSEFERFFRFRPGQGMETYRDKRNGSGTANGAMKPEEKFASIFKR